MIENPDLYLEDFRSAGADSITVHYETCPHLYRTVQKTRAWGRGPVSVSIRQLPKTLLSDIITDADMILIMSVNPGFGGQTFIPSSVEKIRRTSAMAFRAHPGIALGSRRRDRRNGRRARSSSGRHRSRGGEVHLRLPRHPFRSPQAPGHRTGG